MHKIWIACFVLLVSFSAVAQEFTPIPRELDVNEEKAALGKKLYHDKTLSVDGTLSCASCHMLDKGGVDRLPTSTGVKGQKGPINSPTVYNSAANFVQFWDGRAANLEEQALGPVENPLEMGDKWSKVVQKVEASTEYKQAFDTLYDGKVTKENIANAIAEFEKTLITPDSRFDQYLRGNKQALSAIEKKGMALFEEKGCTSCHNGTYLGGNTYQYMSEEYFADRGGKLTDADLGRYNVTKDEGDKHLFKVPMLRNVAVTAPYYHDGSVKTLDEAVQKMAKYQLGEELKKSEVNALVAFLKTLTGKYEGKLLK